MGPLCIHRFERGAKQTWGVIPRLTPVRHKPGLGRHMRTNSLRSCPLSIVNVSVGASGDGRSWPYEGVQGVCVGGGGVVQCGAG